MPQAYNPGRGWIGTCNHKVTREDFPYYYSSHLSPSYRYRRLKQLLDRPGVKTADDHWQFQRDTKNLFAVQMTPIIVKALSSHDELKEMVQILSQWDFKDDPDSAAPAIFQEIFREFAILVYQDELGDDLSMIMLDNWYFWQERLGRMVARGSSPWFDNIRTGDKTEEKDQIKPYMNGDKLHWWFSDDAIKAHAETTLILESKGN